ncbi:MAG: MoaD/ThiS family protein [Planctomycetes bacterium]|nr:MoaD/ThiS family protein [Planctomycetota bacterium]
MKVLLFARARDLVGADWIDIESAATVGEVRARLKERYRHLSGLVEKSALAVNNEFADDLTPIPAGAEVALLPPVSGG